MKPPRLGRGCAHNRSSPRLETAPSGESPSNAPPECRESPDRLPRAEEGVASVIYPFAIRGLEFASRPRCPCGAKKPPDTSLVTGREKVSITFDQRDR